MGGTQLVVNRNWSANLVLCRHIHQAVDHCILVRLLHVCDPANISELVLRNVLIWSRTFTHRNIPHGVVLRRLINLHGMLVLLIEATAVGPIHMLRILIILCSTAV